MANLILSIFERVITILMFIALAVALVCKKKSKKVPLFIIRPIFLVGLLFIMFQAVFVQRNFTSLDKAIRAYDVKAKPIATLQDEKSTYVIMDEDGSIAKEESLNLGAGDLAGEGVGLVGILDAILVPGEHGAQLRANCHQRS